MFVGRLDVEVKGLDLLVEAYARAVQGRGATSATLTLVGPDWRGGAAPLRELSRRLGVADQVVIRDRVNAAEVPALILDCDVYVQLSRNESSPLSLNDALALGRPVIVSDRVGTVSSEDIARLPQLRVVAPSVEAASLAIGDAIDDLEGFRRTAASARDEVRELLSWRRAAGRHLAEYETLVSEASGKDRGL
jgi:glycosyltransferase involved in cell wall biosynthesis